MIRPAVEAVGLPWYRWHGFRRGIAYNLYELGANDKIVQRILRHANPHDAHVTLTVQALVPEATNTVKP